MFQYQHPIAWMFHRSTSNTGWLPSAAPTWPFAPSRPAATGAWVPGPTVRLPAPSPVTMPLGEAIATRHSCRQFTGRPLKLADLSTLLRGAYGHQGTAMLGGVAFEERPVPSAGARYPLQLSLLVLDVEEIKGGIYRYAALDHALAPAGPAPARALIADLFLGQPYLMNASVIVVLTAVVERLLERYGDRGYRYVLFEAGHVGQNLALVATATGIGALSLGGFLDDQLAGLLGLDVEQEIPIYGIALGVPATRDRALARSLGMV